MKIRSITYFFDPSWPLDENALRHAGEFIATARPAFEAAGYEVQTARLATIPFPRLLAPVQQASILQLAHDLEKAARELGYDYVSLGPALPIAPESFTWIPAVLAETESVFLAGAMTSDAGVSLPAVRACAQVIHDSAALSPDGFANLRFAALGNVPPGAPFFPAAYHQAGQPAFALATESADLAVQAFEQADSLDTARQRLVQAVEAHAKVLSETSARLSSQYNLPFGGIDFTLAPFPLEALSFGTALERAGVPAVGLHGSLAAAALLTDTLDRAAYPRAGFNGLMLPVLEDAVLAARAAEGLLTVKDLLLYSTVCGTGLDTVPLPGDTRVEQLYSILLDLAALSLRLDKPLTARLMPIPGKQAGDPTGFDFAYFANSRVLSLEAQPLSGLLAGRETIDLKPKNT